MFKTPSPPSSPPTADTQATFSPPTSHLTTSPPPSHSHLRSLTSSSPRPQQHHHQPPPSPPPPPLPWLWTCHRCYHRYNIAITRRCLSCGHEFCLWQVRYLVHPNKNHTNRDMETQVQALIREGRLCALEFDYLGWRDWMAWRRRLYGWRAREEGTGTGTGMGTGAGSGGRERQGHDCTLDCDYPSQCLRERYLALRDLGLVEEEDEEEEDEEEEEEEEEEGEEEEDGDEEDMIAEEERRQTGRGPWNARPST
ncbi:hypothetical protein E4U44_003851 [Claviceps purpurea]|nr:hypothetical protein E4U44_003851 [Claviceps purpurea]